MADVSRSQAVLSIDANPALEALRRYRAALEQLPPHLRKIAQQMDATRGGDLLKGLDAGAAGKVRAVQELRTKLVSDLQALKTSVRNEMREVNAALRVTPGDSGLQERQRQLRSLQQISAKASQLQRSETLLARQQATQPTVRPEVQAFQANLDRIRNQERLAGGRLAADARTRLAFEQLKHSAGGASADEVARDKLERELYGRLESGRGRRRTMGAGGFSDGITYGERQAEEQRYLERLRVRATAEEAKGRLDAAGQVPGAPGFPGGGGSGTRTVQPTAKVTKALSSSEMQEQLRYLEALNRFRPAAIGGGLRVPADDFARIRREAREAGNDLSQFGERGEKALRGMTQDTRTLLREIERVQKEIRQAAGGRLSTSEINKAAQAAVVANRRVRDAGAAGAGSAFGGGRGGAPPSTPYSLGEFPGFPGREPSGRVSRAEEERRRLAQSRQQGFGAQFSSGFIGSYRPETALPIGLELGRIARISALYSAMFQLQDIVEQGAEEFIRYKETLTDLDTALQGTGTDAGQLANRLASVATAAGQAPSEGLAAGALGVRVFGDEVQAGTATASDAAQLTSTAVFQAQVLSGEDAVKVQTDLVAVAKDYGLTVRELTRVVNAAQVAYDNFGTSVRDTLDGLAQVAPEAAEAQIPLEKAAAQIAVIASRLGVSGTRAAEEYKRILAGITSTQARNVLREAGVDTTQPVGAQVDQLIRDAQSGKIGDAQLESVRSILGQRRSGVVLDALLGTGDQVQQAYQQALSRPERALEVFNKKINDIGTTLARMQQTLKQIVVDLADTGLLDIFALLIEGVDPLLRAFDRAIQVFNEIPRPIRSTVIALGELYLAIRLLERAKGLDLLGPLASFAGLAPRRAAAAAAAAGPTAFTRSQAAAESLGFVVAEGAGDLAGTQAARRAERRAASGLAEGVGDAVGGRAARRTERRVAAGVAEGVAEAAGETVAGSRAARTLARRGLDLAEGAAGGLLKRLSGPAMKSVFTTLVAEGAITGLQKALKAGGGLSGLAESAAGFAGKRLGGLLSAGREALSGLGSQLGQGGRLAGLPQTAGAAAAATAAVVVLDKFQKAFDANTRTQTRFNEVRADADKQLSASGLETTRTQALAVAEELERASRDPLRAVAAGITSTIEEWKAGIDGLRATTIEPLVALLTGIKLPQPLTQFLGRLGTGAAQATGVGSIIGAVAPSFRDKEFSGDVRQGLLGLLPGLGPLAPVASFLGIKGRKDQRTQAQEARETAERLRQRALAAAAAGTGLVGEGGTFQDLSAEGIQTGLETLSSVGATSTRQLETVLKAAEQNRDALKTAGGANVVLSTAIEQASKVEQEELVRTGGNKVAAAQLRLADLQRARAVATIADTETQEAADLAILEARQNLQAALDAQAEAQSKLAQSRLAPSNVAGRQAIQQQLLRQQLITARQAPGGGDPNRIAELQTQLNEQAFQQQQTALGARSAERVARIDPRDKVRQARAALANAADKVNLLVAQGDTSSADFFNAAREYNQALISASEAALEQSKQVALAGVDPRDTVKAASVELHFASVALRRADPNAGAEANAQLVQRYRQARIAYQQQVVERANARDQARVTPGDQVGEAAAALRAAGRELSIQIPGTIEFYRALASERQAREAYAQAVADRRHLRRVNQLDITDPVQVAREELKTAREALARRRTPENVAAVRQAQVGVQAAAFSQRFADAQVAHDLGRTSDAAYLRFLNGQRDSLRRQISGMRRNEAGYRQAVEQLQQVDQAIKGFNDQLQGQFNIGDIKLPTVYEVRRSIQARAQGIGYADQRISNVTVNINGDSIATIKRTVLDAVEGQLRTGLDRSGGYRRKVS